MPRFQLRVVRLADRMYVIGYCLKDDGLAHYNSIRGGFDSGDDLLPRCREFYRANAGKISYSSKKMNKNPKAEEKQLSFKLGNKVTLSVWFAHHHNLDLLRAQLPLSLLLAWAIETKKYRLDDEVMHGKYGGAVLDPARTNAMLQLAFSASEGAPARESVPLIEKVLYGAEQEHPRDNGRGMGDGLRDIPSTYDLVNMTLKEAKSLTKVLREQSGTVPTEHTAEHGGHAVIVDLFSSAASADAAEALEKVR